jgi:hypothetical protein
MPQSRRLDTSSSRRPRNSNSGRPSNSFYTRVDNGLFLVNDGAGRLGLRHAKEIHLSDAYALAHEYERQYLPHGLRLYTMQAMRHVYYNVCHGERVVFRAVYQLDADELTDVRTIPAARNRGIARTVLAIILRTDGPKLIRVGPSADSPIGLNRLIRFYSSFPGYHHVPGTNKVIRLMEHTKMSGEQSDYAQVETAAATDFGRRAKSGLELSVLEQNSRELKRIMDLLHPINEAEVTSLLNAQATDMLALQTAMQIYDEQFFLTRTWGRAHRVMFAQGMASLLEKHAGMRFGLWDQIVREESF